MINREAIYAALFTRLTSVLGFVTTSRLLRHWTDVPAIEQPALFLAQGRQHVKQTQGEPPIWTLNAMAYVYVSATDPAIAPATLLNPLLDAIELALKPDDLVRGTLTLGGLVSRAWIDGAIESSEGLLGSIEVALIPIAILATV